ncbi:MAG: sensor signal transduction histidine kinase [Polaromonas sp.]|nr:sensor signal transduction histidine kinase [Polaromonas sp.]
MFAVRYGPVALKFWDKDTRWFDVNVCARRMIPPQYAKGSKTRPQKNFNRSAYPESRQNKKQGDYVNMAGSKPLTLSGTEQQMCDHKPPDEAMRTGDAQFRLLMDAMPQIVWIMQPDGRHSYFNQRWLDYSGWSMEQSLCHGWAGLIHPDDSSRVGGHWAQACASVAPHEVEFRLRRADGIYRWMLGRASAQCDAAGRIIQWLGTLTDIDDLKQATAHLESNLSMTRIAGRAAQLGGWTIELPDRVLTWSDENCIIHDVPPGYRPTLEEGISYFLPEHQPIVSRHVRDCAQHGTPYEFVLPKLTATGRRIWVRSIGEAVRDAAGNIIRLQGAFQDITAQKEAEARTQALEAQLITTLESITDGFFLLDKDWKFTFLNGQAERMLQRPRKDLLGKNLWQEFPKAVGTRTEHEFLATVQAQCTSRFETFYLPLNSWFVFHVYPTEAGLAVYFQDITERRLAHAQLRLLETAVSRLNDVVVITEAIAVDQASPRIVFVNDAFERQTGYSRQEALGNTPQFLWGAKTQRAELDRMRAAMDNWQPMRTELVIYTKAGEERWLEIDIAPMADESGQFTHWVGVERDITERRQQQQEILSLNTELEARVLLRTAQLATATEELESFAYSVSHDLRSPLNTIHAFSQLLVKIDGDQISDKGKHYLDRIGVGVKQMGDLIEGLLTLAQLSREQLKAEQVDLSAIARRIEQDCRTREPQRQAQMHIHDGLSAHGDARLLSAVFQNLLGNAWKFTSRQSQANIEVGSEAGIDGDTVFYVKDNGAGFDMAFAPKLFGTFERLHSPEDFTGAGIGLATVKRIVERHGGRVWAQSKLNEGAMFFFTLGRGMRAAR